MIDVTVTKRELLKLVSRCQGIAQPKSSMPALANVLVSAESDGTVRVSATDLYVSVSGSCQCETRGAGAIGVHAKLLHERLKMMPEGPVVVACDDKFNVTLRSKVTSRRYTMRGLPAEEFPPLAEVEAGAMPLSMSLGALSLLLNRTHFAISTEEARPALSSALMQWENETVRVVTTDGHRLCKQEIRFGGVENRAGNREMLLQSKAVAEIRRFLDEARASGEKGAAQEVEIVQSGVWAFFWIGDAQFAVKLVDAHFPPFAQVIGTATFEGCIKAPRMALADAVRAVSVASTDRVGGVKLDISPGRIGISAESPESGNGSDEVIVDYSGNSYAIGVAAKYMLDVLGSIDSEEVDFVAGSELDPIMLRPSQQPEGHDYTAIIMPMRI